MQAPVILHVQESIEFRSISTIWMMSPVLTSEVKESKTIEMVQGVNNHW